ncbi:PfkB family carbohydrate kinase [Neobacillus vireti]|uniref:PfkB family carbohydrate kinase n=1 Tax=Neobacillus vireti TaxID=220686 RepID=UPI002FFDED65
MKIIGIGDSVVDYYKDQDHIYPGGNVVNVPVFAKWSGAQKASYLGIVGTDIAGDHLLDCLHQEGIDTSRVRRVQGPTGEAVVTLNESGDRVFVGTNKETRVTSLVSLSLNQEDLEYISNYQLVHAAISINNGIERELPKLADMPIAFDFSSNEYWTKEYLEQVCPYLNYAFLSGSNLSDLEVIDVIEFVAKLGVNVVGVTRGELPAVFYHKGKRFEQKTVSRNVVDTMGAGDSFIASFLTHFHSCNDLQGSLQAAAQFASEVCGYYGAFGYGLKVEW